MTRNRGPLTPIVAYHLIFGRRGGITWQFTLYCGHQVERPVHNRQRDRLKAGADLPPVADRVHCEHCWRELWEERVEQLPNS